MTQTTASRTRVDDVRRELRDDIFSGRLAPGEKVNLGDVSKRLGVSLTVVREAATRLSSERLLELVPQQGFRVWPLSIEHLTDLTRVRIEIERLTLSDSVDHGTVSWEADVLAAHHRLESINLRKSSDAATWSAWIDAHSAFHAALAEASTSPLLKDLRQRLFDSAELYRHWSKNAQPVGTRRNVKAEHQALRDAALARNGDLLVALACDHIQLTSDFLVGGRQTSSLHV